MDGGGDKSITRDICIEMTNIPFHPIRPYNYGLNAALAHNDGHISRLFVDCISYI